MGAREGIEGPKARMEDAERGWGAKESLGEHKERLGCRKIRKQPTRCGENMAVCRHTHK